MHAYTHDHKHPPPYPHTYKTNKPLFNVKYNLVRMATRGIKRSRPRHVPELESVIQGIVKFDEDCKRWETQYNTDFVYATGLCKEVIKRFFVI